MPSKRRKASKKANTQNTQNDSSQIEPSPTLRWTDEMVQAALDEALQQDQLGKRAGQGFKNEAMIYITAAAQTAVEPRLVGFVDAQVITTRVYYSLLYHILMYVKEKKEEEEDI